MIELSKDKTYEMPAFDTVRASVNLIVAGILISVATSMKLPLSTTYVTFMVAMGTSLADRAWGRESAVYRVAGVINVVGEVVLDCQYCFYCRSYYSLPHSLGCWNDPVFVGSCRLFNHKKYTYSQEKNKGSKKARIHRESGINYR